MSVHDGEHAGWVYKQGSLVRNWKKRFMVLRGKQLTYYDTAKLSPRVKEKGSFQVITVELSSDLQNGLIVHGRGGRVLKLYTDSTESTNGWFQAIMDATTSANMNGGGGGGADRSSERFSVLSESTNGSSVDLDDVLTRLDSLPVEENQVQHSGWLTKEGMRIKSWKRRFFSLRGDTLSYFNSEDTGSNAKGYGHVRAVEVNGEKAHSLDIRFDNGRILRVCAESAQDMEVWLCMLSDAIEAASIDNNMTRQSVAIKQNMRASMTAASRSSFQSTTPMRHSMPTGLLAGRPTLTKGGGKGPPVMLAPTAEYDPDRSASSNDSYLSSNESYLSSNMSFAQSSTVSNQDDEYYSDDSDEGDWI